VRAFGVLVEKFCQSISFINLRRGLIFTYTCN
jgi:hypothetical protein